MDLIAQDFGKLELDQTRKIVKVGIVGEIYVKYASLGNNCLEDFLKKENCEVNLPGMMNFVLFKIDNRIEDINLYGGSFLKKVICKWLFNQCMEMQKSFNLF